MAVPAKRPRPVMPGMIGGAPLVGDRLRRLPHNVAERGGFGA